MRRLLKIVAILVLLLLVLIVSVPFLVPVGVLKSKAVDQIQAMTGRKVVMGDVKLSLFPNIALTANDVSIGNPSWVKAGGSMAEVKTLRMGVELMPLLHQDIHITDLTLDTPVIHLVKNGELANWQFAVKEAPASPSAKKAEPEVKVQNTRVSVPLRLDTLTIRQGMLSYEDMASGAKQSLSAVDLRLNASDLAKEVSLKGDAQYNGKKIALDLNLASPLTIATPNMPSSLDVKLAYDPIQLSAKGKLGIINAVPSFAGEVVIPELNLPALTGAHSAGAAPSKTPAAAPAAQGGARWSSEPMNLAVPAGMNAVVDVTLGKLVLEQTTLSDIKANVKLVGGRTLTVTTSPIAFYSGTAKFTLALGNEGTRNIDAQLIDIRVEPLLQDFARSKAFSGTMSATVALSARGNSQKALVSSLDGTGNVALKDGTFRGGNLVNMTKNIATSFQGGQSRGETTDFSSLTGSFTAKNGVFTNNDLRMTGTLLNLSGNGQIDLPEWLVHYLLTPTLVTNRGSETQAASGIAVPVQVEGSLDSPSYHPDLRGVVEESLKDPQKLKDNLKNIKGNLKNINSDTLKGLLGR